MLEPGADRNISDFIIKFGANMIRNGADDDDLSSRFICSKFEYVIFPLHDWIYFRSEKGGDILNLALITREESTLSKSVKIGGIKLKTRSCTCTGVPSTLVSSGKQGATASCKTCRGRSLVDGIGSVSARMMSTVGLELTNFLNPDLTWKTVSKGNRSATRRTRKHLGKDLMAGVEIPVKRPIREEDSTVSESEKLGVAVLGRRFSDQIEHVPIKKRKFNLTSPSPPPRIPSPLTEVVQQASSNGFSQNSNGNTLLMTTDAPNAAIVSPVVNRNIQEAVNDNIGYGEDFSGIEMLAAAACSDNFDVDQAEENSEMEEHLHKENESVLAEETVAPLETVNISPKDPGVKEIIEESSFRDVTATSAQKSPIDKVEKMVDRSASSRDYRLHWDLNVVIDAWEKPCNIENVGSQTNSAEVSSVVGSGKLHILEGCQMERETEIVKHDDMVRVDSSEVHEVPLDSRGSGSQLEICTGLDCNQDECRADAKASTQVVSKDICNNVPCEDNGTSKTLPPNYLVKKTEGCPSGAQEEKTVSTENVEVEKYDVTSPRVSALDRVTCEIDCTSLDEKAEDSGRASNCAPQGMLPTENSQVVVPVSLGVEPASKPEELDANNPLPTAEVISTTSAFVGEVHPVVSGVEVGIANEALEMNDSKINSPVDVGSALTTHEKCRVNIPTNSVGEVKTEDPSKEICESDITQESKVHIAGMENSGELHTGYDSQFEDGELRESDVHGWEDLEADGMEIEQVDYESECDGERLCPSDVEDTEDKGKIDVGYICGSGVMDEKIEQCAAEDAFGDHHLTRSKMRTSESKDGSKIKNYTVDSEDGPDSKDFTSRMVESRVSKRELISRIQGSLPSDVVQRNRLDVFDDFCPRSGRGLASNKFMGRDRTVTDTRCRSPGGGSILNARHSPTYPYGSGRPRNVIENRRFVMSDRTSEAVAVEEFDNRVRTPYLSSSSNSVYRPLNRRYLAYRDDIYGHQAGTALVRDDISPDRSRFRKYPQGVNRGIREDYCRPMPYYASGYPDHMRHRLSRRERSISPLGGERLHFAQPYKKSLSRSRSRSPSAWLPSRERNEGSRRRSRSPIFRSGRIDRVRLPFQKQFVAEYDEGFMSSPRNRFSPHRSSRYDDRVSTLDNFRDRRSPVRMFRQSQRFDSVRSIRPMGHPRRYADMGGAGRRYKYEGANDDGRKQGNRYEMMHRVRRYDTDGVMRRLRYNPEDAMVASDS